MLVGASRWTSFDAIVCLSSADPIVTKAIMRGWSAISFTGTNVGTVKMIGRWEASIHPFAQSILGWKAANQGYPKIT